MSATIELLLMIASLIMIGIIFFSIYSFRKQRGIRYLLGLLVCRFVYVGGVILETSVYTMAEKLFFRNLYQTSLNMMVPLFALFVLEWAAPHRPVKKRWKIGMIVAFAIWSMQMWLDAEVNWIYRSVTLIDGDLVISRSAYSLSFTVICLLLLIGCVFVLVQYMRNIRSDLRKAGMWVLLLASFLLLLEVMKFVAPQWLSWLLPLTVYCSFIGMTMLVIILRSRLFSLVPIARSLVLDTLQEGIVVANTSGKIIDSNKQFDHWCAKLGHFSLTERKLKELLAPWPDWLALCEAMQQGHTEIQVQIDGARRNYRVNVYPLYILQEQRQGSISLLVDITEKQQHLEQIARLSEMKDQLIAIVSHDIRGPLALQYQLIELLENDLEQFPEVYREVISQLSGQIRNTLGMTTNLLEWFRSRRDDMRMHLAPLVLGEVVEDCIHAMHTYSVAKNIRVTHAIPPDLILHTDREMIGLILRNLLSNAIKFTEPGGAVHVDAEPSAERTILSVQDNGIGMTSEMVQCLQKDERLAPSEGTAGERGAGLGLLVTRQFIVSAGGTFSVQSRPGEGTIFQFTVKGGTHHEGSSGG